jgi:WD40 repeat protein
MAISYRASEQGLKDINWARIALGWNRTDDRWLEKSQVSRATLNRFLKGEPVKHDTFVAICAAVGIENWKRVRQSEVDLSIQDELLSQKRPEPQGSQLQQFADQMRRWFEALRYEIEQEEPQTGEYFEWVVRVPVRSRFDRILLRGITREIQLADLREMEAGIKRHLPDETWLVTDYRVSTAVLDWAQKQSYKILCLTFDELIEQDVDFSPYIQWLTQEVQSLGIDEDYIQLNCSKPEIDVVTQAYLGTSHYGVAEGGVEGYIDQWLEAPEKDHISVLGEFGTGKTWFTLHYAWRELQKYQVARQKKMKRSRLPLVMPLRDYAKAVDVENVLAHFFFGKHGIRLNNAVFDRLNEMGKLLLIFDGFDEMADRTNKQVMADNFWQLAQVAVPGSKVILTSRKEHFPNDGDVRLMFSGQVMASKEFKLVAPKFEVLELEQFDEGQIRQVLGWRTDAETVELIVGNDVLLDLARRPVMGQLLVTALADLQVDLRSGVEVNVARVYYYAMRRKMEQDIKTERTFTSLADKTYFLCELAWEMLSQDRLTLNFREFPDRLRAMFGLQDKDIDHWCYDMMGNSLLIRDGDGNYKFAHKSLAEFFVAYKFAAELGLLHRDFWGLMAEVGIEDTHTWSEYCGFFACREEWEQLVIKKRKFQGFKQEPKEQLVKTFGDQLLTNVVINILLPLLDIEVFYREHNVLLELIQWTKGRPFEKVKWLGSNAGNLLLRKNRFGLEYHDLTMVMLPNINLQGVGLRKTNLAQATLLNSLVPCYFSICNTIIISPDNNWFATGHIDGNIRLWNTINGQELLVLTDHESSVTSLTISKNGRYLFSGSFDGTLKKWDMETGVCILSWLGHRTMPITPDIEASFDYNFSVTSMVISNDSRWIFSSSNDKTVKKWDVETGECIQSFVGHLDWITSVALSADGNCLFSGDSQSNIKAWSIETSECILSCHQGNFKVTALVASMSGEWLFSSSWDSGIKKWSIKTGECVDNFDMLGVESLVSSSNGYWLFSGGLNKTIRQWDIETGQCVQELLGNEKSVKALSLSNDDAWLVSNSDDTIRKWNLETGQCALSIVDSYERIMAMEVSNDGCWLFSNSDNIIRKWDIETGECVLSFSEQHESMTSLILSSDNHWLFSWNGNKIKKWDIETGKCVLSFSEQHESTTFLILSSDDRWLFSGGLDQVIRKWDVGTGECTLSFYGHQKQITFLTLSSDDSWLFSGSDDADIKKWNTKTGECLLSFSGHQKKITSLVLSPDDCWLFSGSDDAGIKKWNAKTGFLFSSFPGHQYSITSLILSSHGHWLFSSSDDRIIKKWNIATGECTVSFLGHINSVSGMLINNDGSQLFSNSGDGIIKKWDTETGKCLLSFHYHAAENLRISIDNHWIFVGSYNNTIGKVESETGRFVNIFDNRLCAETNIQDIKGLTDAQRDSLISLGAI